MVRGGLFKGRCCVVGVGVGKMGRILACFNNLMGVLIVLGAGLSGSTGKA